jgi:TonB family protein
VSINIHSFKIPYILKTLLLKKNFLSLLLIGITAATAQTTDTTKILYNSNWQEIKTGAIRYVGFIWQEENKWRQQAFYYPEGTLKMDGIYSDKTLKLKDGLFTSFHKNGMMEDSCLYIASKHHGTEINWDEDGNQRLLYHWYKDLPVDTALWWNKNGKITAVQITDSSGNGIYNSYLDDGKTPQIKGKLLAGLRDGNWIFKDEKGIMGISAVYEKDSALMVSCFDEKGEMETEKKDCQIEKPAGFPGGINAWRKYLERNLDYPKDAVNNNIQGVVRIQFNIEKDGSVSDVKVASSPHEILSNEGMRLIKKSPKWQPALQYNRAVIYRHIQSITFSL